MHLKEVDVVPGVIVAYSSVDQAFVAVSPYEPDQLVPALRGDMVLPVPGVKPEQVGVKFLNQLLNLWEGFSLPIFLEILVRPSGIPIRHCAVGIFPILPV